NPKSLHICPRIVPQCRVVSKSIDGNHPARAHVDGKVKPTMMEPHPQEETTARGRLQERRRFVQQAAAGTTLALLGGALYAFSDELTADAHAATTKDGRPRLPPGQRVLEKLKPMGGSPGDPRTSSYRLKVHGLVERPL